MHYVHTTHSPSPFLLRRDYQLHVLENLFPVLLEGLLPTPANGSVGLDLSQVAADIEFALAQMRGTINAVLDFRKACIAVV